MLKILQICHRIPYPAIDGGNIAMMNIAMALTELGHEVHQFALNTSRHYLDTDAIPLEIREKLHLTAVPIDTKIKGKEVVKNLFGRESYNISRFYNISVERKLDHLLRVHNFDIVQLETLFTTPYIPVIRKNSSAKIVLRAHNVEHIIWRRLAEKEKRMLRKKYLNLLAARLKKYEIETLKEIDALIPISSVDENIFRQHGFRRPLLTLPISLNMKDYNFDPAHKTEMCLFHLGSMDWLPNQEAVDWFLKRCWQQVHEQLPELKLYLAGRSFPGELSSRNDPNVICEGRIEDAHAYMRSKQIMIVPLHSGSGMRVKIIQGMALGKTIISTSVGAEGIPAEHETNILIANTPDEFVTLIRRCVENPGWCKEIGNKARKFAEQNYSNQAIGQHLSVFYKALRKLR